MTPDTPAAALDLDALERRLVAVSGMARRLAQALRPLVENVGWWEGYPHDTAVLVAEHRDKANQPDFFLTVEMFREAGAVLAEYDDAAARAKEIEAELVHMCAQRDAEDPPKGGDPT